MKTPDIPAKQLRRLIKKYSKQKSTLSKWIKKTLERAGHSNDATGLGDEGWNQLIKSKVELWTLVGVISDLQNLLLASYK